MLSLTSCLEKAGDKALTSITSASHVFLSLDYLNLPKNKTKNHLVYLPLLISPSYSNIFKLNIILIIYIWNNLMLNYKHLETKLTALYVSY